MSEVIFVRQAIELKAEMTNFSKAEEVRTQILAAKQ